MAHSLLFDETENILKGLSYCYVQFVWYLDIGELVLYTIHIYFP